jgi:hypothetical protein
MMSSAKLADPFVSNNITGRLQLPVEKNDGMVSSPASADKCDRKSYSHVFVSQNAWADAWYKICFEIC